ncbi:MAG: ribosomal protein S18-alanine N-acetyltransferase [Euryarchaeota archaeon]|nr:ribosomal protein S18-alanine N-acetyltransferase [Euryarchaeota archaeon]
MLRIRNFTPEDLEQVCEIQRICFSEPYTPEFIMNIYEAHGDTFFVAELGGRVVGYAAARIISFRGHVIVIAVHPGFRRLGIGMALMLVLEHELRKRHALEVWLEVRASNTGAMDFYRRLGYVEKSVLKRYYSDGEDAVVFTKVL